MSLARWGNLCNSSSTRSLWTMLLSSRVSLLEDLENCPRKYLKIFSTEFIFRQQKILLTIDVIERYRSLADWSWTIKYVVSFLCQFWHSSHNSESRNFLHCKFYPVLTNFMANFNVLFFYMWASDLNFLLSLLAQQTLGAGQSPARLLLSWDCFWDWLLRETKAPLDLCSYFVSVFTDQEIETFMYQILFASD